MGRTFSAPGRVNLIGEHTDYNDGFVMPAAIGLSTRVEVSPRGDRLVSAFSQNFGERACFDLDVRGALRRGHWSDYVFGVAAALEESGRRLRGADLVINGGVPIGSGLSSSAAIEVAVALALLAASEIEVNRTQIALLCRRAENEFVGTRAGIMDPFASCYGKAGHAILLDCRSLERRYEPLPADVGIVVCDTMVRRQLASGEYNVRRGQCEDAVQRLARFRPGIAALRDVTPDELEARSGSLPTIIYRRARHVVRENQRVLRAAAALQRGELKEFGALMTASHESLRDDYEVSSPELDLMVDLALDVPGVIGARMMGGGFGGCTINLVTASLADRFAREIADAWEQRSGNRCTTYVLRAEDGAGEVG